MTIWALPFRRIEQTVRPSSPQPSRLPGSIASPFRVQNLSRAHFDGPQWRLLTPAGRGRAEPMVTGFGQEAHPAFPHGFEPYIATGAQLLEKTFAG